MEIHTRCIREEDHQSLRMEVSGNYSRVLNYSFNVAAPARTLKGFLNTFRIIPE